MGQDRWQSVLAGQGAKGVLGRGCNRWRAAVWRLPLTNQAETAEERGAGLAVTLSPLMD